MLLQPHVFLDLRLQQIEQRQLQEEIKTFSFFHFGDLARLISEVWRSLVNYMPGNALKMLHYDDVIMGAMTSQITSLTIVYLTVYSGADKRKHQSSASLAFVKGLHRGPVNSPHKWPVMRKTFPFDDVIMRSEGIVLTTKSHMFLLIFVGCRWFWTGLVGQMRPFEIANDILRRLLALPGLTASESSYASEVESL